MRYMPDHETIRRHKHLQMFGSLLHSRHLWGLTRRSVATAFAVGLFFAFVPVPFQMVLAAAAAIALGANLPISVALVWLTNPLTMPPIFYGAYKFGAWVMNAPPHNFDFEPSLEWVLHGMEHTWQPFLLGCLLLGLIFAVVGYITVFYVWRVVILKRWRNRKPKG